MDEMDRAAKMEQDFRERAIAAQRIRPAEEPDEDEHGRYCLDCGAVIPELRIKLIANAVRCVACQTKKERLHG